MIQRLYRWYGKKTVWTFLVILSVLIIIGFFIKSNTTDNVDNSIGQLPLVQLALVRDLSNGSSLNIIGSVEAISEAHLEAETGGRVTSVSVSIGDVVDAGTVIVKIENAGQYASLLQAEGVYEMALAVAAQSDVSTTDAETSLTAAKATGLNTYRSAFTAADDLIRNLADNLFSNPGELNSGFRLNSDSRAPYLNDERREIEVILNEWSKSIFMALDDGSVLMYLSDAETDTRRVALFIEELSSLVSDKDNENTVINGVGIDIYKTKFLGARNALNATLQSITTARTAIENAEEGLQRALIAGTDMEVSVADAQVKQALGALRAAQAAFAKTIIKTPIAGMVNKVDVKKGDFVGMFTPVATIANNDALEITTFVGEADRERLSVGDMVLIEGGYIGMITNIAPAVDPVTKKIEVKIQTETDALANGDTVRISITSDDTRVDTDETIKVPLTAVKFSATQGSVFTVEDGALVAHEVVLGDVSGSNIIVTEGIVSDMEIVTDARGLNSGQKVETIKN